MLDMWLLYLRIYSKLKNLDNLQGELGRMGTKLSYCSKEHRNQINLTRCWIKDCQQQNHSMSAHNILLNNWCWISI